MHIEVQTQDYLNDLQQRIGALVEELNVEVLQLRRARTNRQVSIEKQQKQVLSELTPLDVFEQRLAQETFETEQEQQRRARIITSFQNIVADVKEAK